MAELPAELNRLAGTTGLDAAGAANVWAGTTGLELVGALNAKAGTVGRELAGVLNTLAGTTGLGVNAAAAAITGEGGGGGETVTYTIYADAVDGYAFAATAFAATAASVGGAGYVYVGQEVGGFYEGFLSFDTSAVEGTITSATLHLYGQADFGAGIDTWEVRAHDWGATLETTDWVSRANLPSLTLLASKAGAISTSSYNAFTSEAAFVENINQSGTTRLLINSLRHRTSVAPAGVEYARFESWDTGGETTGPKLVIEATA